MDWEMKGVPWEDPVSFQTGGRQRRRVVLDRGVNLNDMEGSISMGIECTANVQRLSSWRGRQQPIRVQNGQNKSDDLLQSHQDWFG